MKKKLFFYVLAVVFIANFSLAKNEQQKRRRPIIDSVAQDSDGNFIDQIASDSINYSSANGVTVSDNYPKRYHTATDDFQKASKKPQTEEKVHYITPEPYSKSFSQDYVNNALKTHENRKEKGPASSFLEYSTVTKKENYKIPKIQRQKVYSSESEDYNYYFPESKRITAKTTVKPTTTKDFSEKYYKPQSSGAIITKDLKTNGDENVNTYHYYYPEEPSHDDKPHQHFPSSTFAPTTTRFPKLKFSAKKKTPSVQVEQTSTDSYQYQPVLQRPNEFVSDQEFYPAYDTRNYAVQSTSTPSTASPIKMLRPTKKNNYYLPSSPLSPSSTAKPMKIRRPSTESPFEDFKQLSVSPSPSTMSHYSTTRSPEIHKFSTPSPVSSTTLGDFYIKPSTQVTPTAAVDLQHDGSERTVVIRPKPSYQSYENYQPEESSHESFANFQFQDTDYNFQPKATIKKTKFVKYENIEPKETVKNLESRDEPKQVAKETIIYKFVPEETYNYGSKDSGNYVTKEVYSAPKEGSNYSSNETFFYSTAATFPDLAKSPDFYKNLNETTQADMDFYNDFHKSYNYEYFTEQDAGRMSGDANDDTQKMDQQHEFAIDEKQRATNKNMFYEYNPHVSDEYYQSSMMNLDDHEVPPPMHEITGDRDNDAEASKNQYFVLYSVDDEEKEKKQHKKPKKKQKQEPEVVYHHHHHEHDEKPEEYQHFNQEFDSEFDTELTNSDNVRIVDPNVRGGRPIEFTKDDYLRHIKQAVVQYMKDNPAPSENSVKVKNQRLQESEVPYRPTKTHGAATTASSYKQSLPSQQYKSMSQLKLPKNVYTAGRLKDALEELHESPQVDLTVKKNKQKPFDLSAIDVGQSYQHVSHFDHSAALKNVEEFDTTNVVAHQQQQGKPKLHFSQQTYHDINNLGYNQKQKQQQPQQQFDDSENEQQQNLYKGYMLNNKYSLKGSHGGNSFSSMSYDGSKLPKIVTQRGSDDDDEDDKVEDPVDAPIQIINGIPVANPYNIDLNTLKYMLGGIAQAEVNDQLKDLDESAAPQNQKFPANWNSYSPNQFGSYTSNNPVYQVYGQENNQRPKKNSGQTGNHGANSQKQFPLVGSLLNYNKNKSNQNKQKNSQSGGKHNQNFPLSDFSGWNQNKKQRTEPQAAPSNSHFVLRPVLRNKQARDEKLHQKGSINRARQPQLATEMRPPPPIKQRPHQVLVKKVI